MDISALLEKALGEIYREKGKPALNQSLFRVNNAPLQEAVNNTFSKMGIAFGKRNERFMAEFRHNTAVFAAFKTHEEQRKLSALFIDSEGSPRSFYEFRKLSKEITGDYNINWLRTEYNTAVRSARMAANWKKFEETKHIYPNLEFMRTRAAAPREGHLPYVGTILPMDHPWWQDHTPPLDWGCQCWIRQTRKAVTGIPGEESAIDPVFRNNPGISAEFVKLSECAYIRETDEETKAFVAKELKRLETEEIRDNTLYTRKKFKSGGLLELPETGQNKVEEQKNLKAYETLSREYGEKYRLLPIDNTPGKKNPDALNLKTKRFSDVKVPVTSNGKNAIQASIKAAEKQKAGEVYIWLEKEDPMLER